jgi:hypothetical protein
VGRLSLGLFEFGQQSSFKNQTQVSSEIQRPFIGRESVPLHIQNDQEFSLSLEALLTRAGLLFNASWTAQRGGGRPLAKDTGRPLAEALKAVKDTRDRVSAPDANSCPSLNNAPYGIVGGGGDFVTGVFILGQRSELVAFDRNDVQPLRAAVGGSV